METSVVQDRGRQEAGLPWGPGCGMCTEVLEASFQDLQSSWCHFLHPLFSMDLFVSESPSEMPLFHLVVIPTQVEHGVSTAQPALQGDTATVQSLHPG